MRRVIVGNTCKFVCVCGEELQGSPADTLLFEVPVSTSETRTENSTFVAVCTEDPAGNVVPLACECGSDFLTMIEILDVTTYVCGECGRQETHNEYFAKQRSRTAPQEGR